jgi:ParB-like chromosome segregation protein Spo0J
VIINTPSDYRSVRANVLVQSTRSVSGPISLPCLSTLLVSRDLVVANVYNPNSVSDDKMALLRQSIVDNGFCFPVVTIWDDAAERFVIIDGFHRFTIAGPDYLDMPFLPVVVLEHDITKRMAATVQFNKARGVHQVDLDAEVIRALIEQGLTEADVSERLGIDPETVHRYKQITGVAELFKNAEYSMSWEMVDDP